MAEIRSVVGTAEVKDDLKEVTHTPLVNSEAFRGLNETSRPSRRCGVTSRSCNLELVCRPKSHDIGASVCEDCEESLMTKSLFSAIIQ